MSVATVESAALRPIGAQRMVNAARNFAWTTPVLISGLFCAWPVLAQNADVQGRTLAATEGSTKPYKHPPLDAAGALSGKTLVQALQGGGFVLYMRHTETGKVTPQCTESNLTARGERDARFVGESIRALKIPVGSIASSPVCRVMDTAKHLGLGKFKITGDLSNVPVPPVSDLGLARSSRIATPPPPDSNTLLVSHMQGGKDIANWINLDFGEIIVYRPAATGAQAIARIRADDWYDLMDTGVMVGKNETAERQK